MILNMTVPFKYIFDKYISLLICEDFLYVINEFFFLNIEINCCVFEGRWREMRQVKMF